MLDLHPDATKHFNELAARLIDSLAALPPEETRAVDSAFRPDLFVAHSIDRKDIIGEMDVSSTDASGNVMALYFEHEGRTIGLTDIAYKEFARLAEAIHRTGPYKDSVTEDFVQKHLFHWIRDAYRKTAKTVMTDYLAEKCRTEVKDLEVWVPIAMLSVQSEFPVGSVMLKPITEERFEGWRRLCMSFQEKEKDQINEWFDRKRRDYQGYSAGVMRLTAEPGRAREVAEGETELALAMLRFFCPASLDPRFRSYTTVRGKENIQKVSAFIFQGSTHVQMTSRVLSHGNPNWVMDNEQIHKVRSTGLDTITDMLRAQSRTPLQERILNALLLYSQVSVSIEPSDKLVYLLTSLESILLKNDSEPIQQNLAERLARIVGRDLEERKAIIRVTKDIYASRSAFLHHGYCLNEMDTLGKFMFWAWQGMLQVLQHHNRYKTHEQLLTAVDDTKLM